MSDQQRIGRFPDTGTIKTILAERIWETITDGKTAIKPQNTILETYTGGPVQTISLETCRLQINDFDEETEVIIVKRLVFDCLLGLEVAFRLKDVKTYLNAIKEASRPKLREEINTTYRYRPDSQR